MANIISLTIENFRSYKNKTTFTFEAVDVPQMSDNYHEVELRNGEKVRLLNTAVVYGANAAGKSNVIIALWALYSFVKFSRRTDPNDGVKYEPYLLSSKSRKSPIFISIRFVSDGVIYEYSISYNQKAFLTESLLDVNHGALVFERGKTGDTHFNPDYLPGLMDETYLPNHLSLSELSMKADALIQSIYRELTSMRIVLLNREYGNPINTIEDVKRMWVAELPNSYFARMLKKLILSSDTGIMDIEIKELQKSQFRLPDTIPSSLRNKIFDENKYKISMIHQSEEGEPVPFSLEMESTGTQTLFKAGAQVIKALEEGALLVYDEMNIALHPMVFLRLVGLFNDPMTNPYHAQLLVTTHDATLMRGGVLRADQIWLAQKKNGASELYSAIDFNGVSIDQSFEPLYKAGRLGGLPHFTPFRRPQKNPVKTNSDEQK